MKRINTMMIVSLLAVVVMTTGCKREYGTVTLGANIDNGRDAKVYIDDLTPCWHNNDLIRVNNQTCTTSAALGSSAQITDVVESNHYRAIYPADIVGNVDISSSSSTIAVTLPRVQRYEVDTRGDQKVKVPMGAYSDNESLTFHNLCSLIKVVISNQMDYDFLLDSIIVAASSAYLSGLGSATLAGRTSDAVRMMASSSANRAVSLTFTSTASPIITQGDRETYVYYIVAPEFERDDVYITLCLRNESGISTVHVTKPNVSLGHNKIATIGIALNDENVIFSIPNPPSVNGRLPGLFSVSATQQVYFSQGNVQASVNASRFAMHQFDLIGDNSLPGNVYDFNMVLCDNNNRSSSWFDLFNAETINISMSDNGIDFYGNRFCELYNDGESYGGLIINGGNWDWRVLTINEWNYILQTRNNASQKVGLATVNGVSGLILLPDNWSTPEGCTFTSGTNGYTSNIYNANQWHLMEIGGAVFLPAKSDGSGVYDSSTQAYHYRGEPVGADIPYYASWPVMMFSNSYYQTTSLGGNGWDISGYYSMLAPYIYCRMVVNN